MTKTIYYDGSNLALERGTGIATYTRMLTQIVHALGHRVGVFYSSRQKPAKNDTLREIAFFDSPRAIQVSNVTALKNDILDQIRYYMPVNLARVETSGFVVTQQFAHRMPAYDDLFVGRNLFLNARTYFRRTKNFVDLSFEKKPDIVHCTYQLPLRTKGACNIYTIHDLVPLRLPFTSLDNKRQSFRLLKKIAAEADHIVTVSEHSRRDIITLLGVDENRVTNTYQAVKFPQGCEDQSDEAVAEQLEGSYGLEFKNYLLFYGALEPKKNVARLVEAYLASGVDTPLVIISSGGWENEDDNRLIDRQLQKQAFEADGRHRRAPLRRRIYRFDYVTVRMLVTLIKGATAMLFPSLYEGFGLPVLESMLLGAPVVTSRESSLPEIAGDAAIMVNPYETIEIAQAIRTISGDADLRNELIARGRRQAELFSVDRYKERLSQFYGAL